jgi:hypothetical protein
VKLREKVSVETYRRWLKIILFVIALMLLGRIVSMTGDHGAELAVEGKNTVVIAIDRSDCGYASTLFGGLNRGIS